MAGIGIITNPHSKLNKRNPERQSLLGYIAGEKGHLRITNSLNELEKVAVEFRGKKIDTLAINGGDGTVSRTLTAFINAYHSKEPLPKIAILGGGTMNMLASNLKIKSNPERNLYQLLQAHSTNNTLPMISLNTLQIEQNYGFLFANSTSASFLEIFYRNKSNALGVTILVLKIIAQGLFGQGKLFDNVVKSHTTLLRIDGKTSMLHPSTSAFCSTVNKMPMGFELFPLSKKTQFEFVSVTTPPRILCRRLFKVGVLEAKHSSYDKFRFLCSHLQITSEGNNPYTLDGELYYPSATTLEIKLGPKLEFVII